MVASGLALFAFRFAADKDSWRPRAGNSHAGASPPRRCAQSCWLALPPPPGSAPITHESALVAFERSKLALAPLIRSRRKYRLPRLDIPPRRGCRRWNSGVAQSTERVRQTPGKMARSDPGPRVRVTRGAGSRPHLASSVLQEGLENANINAGLGFIWRISDETPPRRVRRLFFAFGG